MGKGKVLIKGEPLSPCELPIADQNRIHRAWGRLLVVRQSASRHVSKHHYVESVHTGCGANGQFSLCEGSRVKRENVVN